MFRRASQRPPAARTVALFAAMAATFLVSCGRTSEEQKTPPTQTEQSSKTPASEVPEKQTAENVTLPETSVAESARSDAKTEPAKAVAKTESQTPKPPKNASSSGSSNPLGQLLKNVDQTLKGKQTRPDTQTESKVHVPAIGEMVPEIEAEDIDGVRFKLSDYRGQVVVLDFWGDW